MIRKLCFYLIGVLMVSVCILCGSDANAHSLSFPIRTAAPDRNTVEYGSGNPYSSVYASANHKGNCTWYAFGRAWEVLGERPGLPTNLNAGNWYSYAARSDTPYTVGSSPRAGSIACYASSGGDDTGHVIFVEEVLSDGRIRFTESNYNINHAVWGWDVCRAQSYRSGFQGFIYLDGNIFAAQDGIIRTENTVRIYGWAYDDDTPDKVLEIHAYFGGPASAQTPCRIAAAGNYRLDLDRNCGYDVVFTVDNAYTVPVYVYAVNPAQDEHLLIAHLNRDPIGTIDEMEGQNGAVYLRGWVFDPDAPSYYPMLHVYVGAGAGTPGMRAYKIDTAEYKTKRADVAGAYPQYNPGDYHGFELVLPVSEIENQEIYVYAINNEKDTNNPGLVLGESVQRNVTISSLEDLQKLILPGDLQRIEAEAFLNCAAEYTVIPESVTSIGQKAFGDCSNLVYIRIPGSTTEIAPDAFDNHSARLTLYCEKDSAAHHLALEKKIRFALVQ